ncbi:T9SS type A sorting domain-containing protein [Hymenobacter cavernae]|nr:T9SS type A sorting domain-containing protein [Hymenobacter cavernae]
MKFILPLTLSFLITAAHVQAQAPELAYSAPIMITQGGTYTGNYRSLSSSVPCVVIVTNEPVILENCTLVGAGDLIQATGGSNLTVRKCRGYGLEPTEDNRPRGRFVDAYQAKQLVVEHNYLEHTTGILANRWSGDGSAQQTLTVRYNQGLNCDGRFRNGGKEHRSFVQLNTVQNLAGIDVSFNEFRNEPNESAVEDNINFYNSSGTAGSPARVHDNYVQGAYPYPATDSHFTGTGMTTDGDGTTSATTTAYLEAYNNQFVSICNAGMNIAAGHDVSYHDNRIITSGLLPDGTRLNATYAAASIFNGYGKPGSVFFGNKIENNTIGYVKSGYNFPYTDRHDQDVVTGGNLMPMIGNNHLPNTPITIQTEQNEWSLWQQKLQQQQLYVGPLATITLAAKLGTTSMAKPVAQELYTLTGRQLWQRPYSEKLDWSQLQPGVYVLRIRHQDGSAKSEKLMIK